MMIGKSHPRGQEFQPGTRQASSLVEIFTPRVRFLYPAWTLMMGSYTPWEHFFFFFFFFYQIASCVGKHSADNPGIISAESQNRDKVRIIQYDVRLRYHRISSYFLINLTVIFSFIFDKERT